MPATVQLFSVNLEGTSERVFGTLGPEYLPSNQLNPSLRLSLAPDGKSITYSIRKTSSNLWLMELGDAAK